MRSMELGCVHWYLGMGAEQGAHAETLCRCLSTGTGCLGRLWSLLLAGTQEPYVHGLGQAAPGNPAWAEVLDWMTSRVHPNLRHSAVWFCRVCSGTSGSHCTSWCEVSSL